MCQFVIQKKLINKKEMNWGRLKWLFHYFKLLLLFYFIIILNYLIGTFIKRNWKNCNSKESKRIDNLIQITFLSFLVVLLGISVCLQGRRLNQNMYSVEWCGFYGQQWNFINSATCFPKCPFEKQKFRWCIFKTRNTTTRKKEINLKLKGP